MSIPSAPSWYSSPVSTTPYLNGLNQAQKEAVLHEKGPLLIIAGAGAGKTRTITHRIARLIESGIPAHRILAVTFTNKAAGEMRERIRGLIPAGRGMPFVSTFHSLCVRILREFGGQVGVPARFSIWDRDDQTRAMKRALKAAGMEDENPNSVLAAVSRAKGSGAGHAAYAARAGHFRERAVARAWEEYEKELAEASALDFDDLLLKALELLESSRETRELLQSRWSHITIDEYQDTNSVQFELARHLTGSRMNICVVADGDQTIYTWRGATIENFLSFERLFPGTKTVRLEENYRSTGTIIAAANGIIGKNRNRIPKELRATRETGEPVYLFEARDEEDEAWFVAERAHKLIERGTPPKEIAVLYRDNFQSRVLEEALLAAGIPYRVVGTRFFERREVKDVLSYVRASLLPASAADISRIAAMPPRGIGQTTLAKMFAPRENPQTGTMTTLWNDPSLTELAGKESGLSAAARAKVAAFRASLARMRHALETLPLSEALRFIVEESGLERMYKERKDREEAERFENVRELVNLAVRYDGETPPEGAQMLLEEAALQSDQDELKEEENRVSLMTVHASKGLEFGNVFVTGLEQGLFPSLRLDEHTDPEEERRLFYVALTRGKERLFLTFARARLRYGSRESAVPSEFLGDIDERLTAWAVAEEAESIIE
ncbi:MAG: DNA/RNA helicase, superfamily I [Candidatus Kaiserbacteria bacterium GW2011_GWA2_58_9]|uniref:DNA 3'-5' helicase n=1 Tax=Candidatus Kaiserbacteria bacterium GW2011_GWA2_58_9 TaxID=1618672 RepID=A0A0G2BPD2_9BACT|nr:MAG: DNA/RNA helicase, superfamily I [Candidatus Kaiserbacteria bacterium GW2011_GWA2_58_9]